MKDFTRSAKFWSLPAIIVAIVAIGYTIANNRADPKPKIAPELQAKMDSLDMTKKSFEHAQDSLRHVVIYDTVKASVHAAAATRATAAAKAAQHVADSLAVAAQDAHDAGESWHKAYDARTEEAVGLRVAAAKSDSAYRFERDARLTLSELYKADTLRRVAIQDLNVGLKKTIEGLERPCKVVKYLSCPSRTTTAVISAVTGALAGFSAKRP